MVESVGDSMAQWLAYLLLHPTALGSNPSVLKKFFRNLMLLRLINRTGWRKVHSGLKMLIEPI